MELKREEYDFLLHKQLCNGYSEKEARRVVGRHCEIIEDIVLPFGIIH